MSKNVRYCKCGSHYFNHPKHEKEKFCPECGNKYRWREAKIDRVFVSGEGGRYGDNTSGEYCITLKKLKQLLEEV